MRLSPNWPNTKESDGCGVATQQVESVYRLSSCSHVTHSVYTTMLARTAGSEYEMNDASISFKATEYTAHFNSKHIDLYIAKLNRLNITDLYKALGMLLMCINIWTDRFPDLQSWYVQLPHQLSLLTLLRIIFKSLQKRAGYKWTQYNFLMNIQESAITTDCIMSSLEG